MYQAQQRPCNNSINHESKDKDKDSRNRERLKELKAQLDEEEKQNFPGHNQRHNDNLFDSQIDAEYDRIKDSPMQETDHILQQIFAMHGSTPLSAWDVHNDNGNDFNEWNEEFVKDQNKYSLKMTPTPPTDPPPSARKHKAKPGSNTFPNRTVEVPSRESSTSWNHAKVYLEGERHIGPLHFISANDGDSNSRPTTRPSSANGSRSSSGFSNTRTGKGPVKKKNALPEDKKKKEDVDVDDEERSVKSTGTSRSRTSTQSRTSTHTTSRTVAGTTATSVVSAAVSVGIDSKDGDKDKDSVRADQTSVQSQDKRAPRLSSVTIPHSAMPHYDHVKSSGYGQSHRRSIRTIDSDKMTSNAASSTTHKKKSTFNQIDPNFMIVRSEDESDNQYDGLMIDMNKTTMMGDTTATEDEVFSNTDDELTTASDQHKKKQENGSRQGLGQKKGIELSTVEEASSVQSKVFNRSITSNSVQSSPLSKAVHNESHQATSQPAAITKTTSSASTSHPTRGSPSSSSTAMDNKGRHKTVAIQPHESMKPVSPQHQSAGPSATSAECHKESLQAAMKQLDNVININPQTLTSHKAVPMISVPFLLSVLAQRLSERRHQKGTATGKRRREYVITTSTAAGAHDNQSHAHSNAHSHGGTSHGNGAASTGHGTGHANGAATLVTSNLIYHTPSLQYQFFYDDWINSEMVLDALDTEQDDLGDRISSFVLSLSDIRKDDVSTRFLESLQILLALHNDLRCPIKQHQLFWKAHCLKACPSNLVSILSRIALLSKSRNILLTILRSVLNRAVMQDKWLWDYASSLYHGHRILIHPDAFVTGEGGQLATMGHQAGNSGAASEGDKGGATGQAQGQGQPRSFLSQYKADTSKDSYLGQTPKQIRESARKTLNFSKSASPSFSSPLQLIAQSKAFTQSSPSSGSDDPAGSAGNPTTANMDTRMSVIRPSNFLKPSQKSSGGVSSTSNSSSNQGKHSRPDSGIANKAIPLKPSLALQQITEDEDGEDEEDEEGEEEEDDDDESEDNKMKKNKPQNDYCIEEGDDEDEEEEEEEIDEEEQHLIQQRKEQFKNIQRLSGLAPVPAVTKEAPVSIVNGAVEEDKTGKPPINQQEPIIINKDDANAAFLQCTAETIQNLVGLWKSSLPWKIEKFIFAGVDYTSELSIYPPEMFLVQYHKNGDDAQQLQMKLKGKGKKKKTQSFKKKIIGGSTSKNLQQKQDAETEEDDDALDDMRNHFQPKMSLPLS